MGMCVSLSVQCWQKLCAECQVYWVGALQYVCVCVCATHGVSHSMVCVQQYSMD
jgi:hypothetical protein